MTTKKTTKKVREVKGFALFTLRADEDIFWVAVSSKREANSFIQEYKLDDAYIVPVLITLLPRRAKPKN